MSITAPMGEYPRVKILGKGFRSDTGGFDKLIVDAKEYTPEQIKQALALKDYEEHEEVLGDLVMLRLEDTFYRGPGYAERLAKAWRRAEELYEP